MKLKHGTMENGERKWRELRKIVSWVWLLLFRFLCTCYFMLFAVAVVVVGLFV